MATVLLPRSLLALFPGVERRHEVDGANVDAVLVALDRARPGAARPTGRGGSRGCGRTSTCSWPASPADLATPVGPDDTVHVIPAVSGGAGAAGG